MSENNFICGVYSMLVRTPVRHCFRHPQAEGFHCIGKRPTWIENSANAAHIAFVSSRLIYANPLIL